MTIASPPPLFETKADDDDDRPKQRTSAMIALRPRQDHIDRLAVKDGEAPEELHTTILFLGKAADYSYDTRDRIIQTMREVAQRFRQVTGDGFAVNRFNPKGDEPCVVLGVSGKEMVDIYNAIVGSLQGFNLLQVPEQHEPWIPHITLKYTDDFSDTEDMDDLTGEVVYDAIRVAFGGIVDDIMFPPSMSADDGYAGGNRYATAAKDMQNLGTCRYCKSKATKKIGIDGGAWIGACEGHEDRARRDAGSTKVFRTQRMPVIEEKVVRHVRTAAGARRFGQPIGSVIVGDGAKLQHLKEQQSEYDGYNKYDVGGRAVYTRKEGSKFVAYDAQDNVLHSESSEEGLLKKLDSTGSNSKAAGTSRDLPEGFTAAKSEYDGYDKFIQKRNGQAVWRDQATGKFYDKDDNEVSIGGDNEADTAAGLKKIQSEYAGYDKFMGQNGEPVWRDQASGKFYDADDKEVDVNDYNGEKVKANLASKPRQSKKPMTATESRNTDTMEGADGKKRPDEFDEPKKTRAQIRKEGEEQQFGETPRERLARRKAEQEAAARTNQRADNDLSDDPDVRDAEKELGRKLTDAEKRNLARMKKRVADNEPENERRRTMQGYGENGKPEATSKPRTSQQANSARELRDSLTANLNASDELNAALDKVEAGGASAATIALLKRIAQRQSDARNRRRINIYADNLKEQKIFDMLVKMDPWLRAITLETKLITPGGRVGSDASLASSPKRNWVENTPQSRLPKYIRIVANGIKGHSKSRRIALAVAAVKRWARGGGNVKPAVRAAAAKAVAEWEALKASA